ncbi:MAG TPA: alanine racemase [Clostridiales bacterium]|nr:alanine racemase [Clostridiales bacterium]
MENKIRAAWVEIDTKMAIKNFERIKKRARENNKDTKICAVVKANSYGMGSIELSKLYVESGVDMLAVAILSEALEIRDKIIDTNILVLGYTPDDLFEDALKNNITLTIYTYEQAYNLNEIAKKFDKKANIHIKIETGMNRLGFITLSENADKIKDIHDLSNINIEGIYTHFARADEKDKSTAHMQMKAFSYFIDLLEQRNVNIPIKHAANSAAIIDLPEYTFDMVRPGIILLGFYPSDEVNKDNLKIEPCITLKAKLANVKTVPINTGISYGHTFKTKKTTVIGTVPLGYADGFSRSLSNNYYVVVKGKKCLLLGRICMDQFMIDLTNVDNPEIGDEVIIYGNGHDAALSIDDVAKMRSTISYEVASTLSYRLPRKYI